MATLQLNWMAHAMSGRPNRKQNVYARTNRQTGKVTLVQMDTERKRRSTPEQTAMRKRFGVLSSACAAFVAAGKEAAARDSDSELAVAYLKTELAFRSQHQYGALRSFIMSQYAVMSDDGTVTVVVDDYTYTWKREGV